jgi:hypothetical protein
MMKFIVMLYKKEEGCYLQYCCCTVILRHLKKYRHSLQMLSLCYNCFFLCYCEDGCRMPSYYRYNISCLYLQCKMEKRYRTRKDLSLVEVLDIVKIVIKERNATEALQHGL